MTTMDTASQGTSSPSYADRLRSVRVGMRQDLHVTRHVFRGEPSYVVRDPMTLQSYRFDPADYSVFVAIDHSRELGEIFEELVTSHTLLEKDEERFYAFIFHLHQLSFLSLPVSDDKLLYQRHVRKKRLRRRQKLTGFLFLQIPLINPDTFLETTLRFARPIFSRWFFALWVCLIGIAGFVIMTSFDQLLQPIQGVLLPQNLPMMWITLIGLKLVHEFGHAYACKHFGGYVPEMGAYLIVFTPCAYVDATACWGFTRKRDRLIVCLAGMYVESVIAALAVLLWAMTEPGKVHDLAYNVIFLASVVTVLFNINPLMRFDGYYVLSDLLEIPNLRQRAARYVTGVAKRLILSVKNPTPSGGPAEGGPGLRMWLLGFGVAATIYRVAIIVGISALVAVKIPGVGIVLAGALLGTSLIGLVTRLMRYLCWAEETAPIRVRAVTTGVVLLMGLPAMILLVPLPLSVYADGVFGQVNEYVVRARVDGFVRAVPVHVGDDVSADQRSALSLQHSAFSIPHSAFSIQRTAAGDVLAELDNDTYRDAEAEVLTAIEASEIRYGVFEVEDPVLALQEREQLAVYQLELARRRRDLADLTIRATTAGTIIDSLGATDLGRYLRKGEPVATVASGAWQVRAILAENEMAAARPTVGDQVEIRPEVAPGHRISGLITRIAPAASRTIAEQALTHLGGGPIAVDLQTAQAEQPYFEITVDTQLTESPFLRHGMVCHVRFKTDSETIGARLLRRLIRFTDMIAQR